MRCQLLDAESLRGNPCFFAGCYIPTISYTLLTDADPLYGPIDRVARGYAQAMGREVVAFEAALKQLNRQADGKSPRGRSGIFSLSAMPCYDRDRLEKLNQDIITAERDNVGIVEYLEVLRGVGYETAELIMERIGLMMNERFGQFLGVWSLTQGIDDIIDDRFDDLRERQHGKKAFNPVVVGTGMESRIDLERLAQAEQLKAEHMAELESYIPENAPAINRRLFSSDRVACD